MREFENFRSFVSSLAAGQGQPLGKSKKEEEKKIYKFFHFFYAWLPVLSPLGEQRTKKKNKLKKQLLNIIIIFF